MQDGLRNVQSSMIQRCENPKRQQYSRLGYAVDWYTSKAYNVGAMLWNYTPRTLKEIMEENV